MVVEESAGTTIVVVRGAGGPPLLMQPESSVRTNKLAKTFMITSLSGAQCMALRRRPVIKRRGEFAVPFLVGALGARCSCVLPAMFEVGGLMAHHERNHA